MITQLILSALSWAGVGINIYSAFINLRRRRDLDRKHAEVDVLRGKLLQQMDFARWAMTGNAAPPKPTKEALS